MEGFAAQKLNEFETGKISRRGLIESLTLAATTIYPTGAADAQADQTLKAQLINHISYTCPNFKQAADWYSMVFNLDQIGATKRDVALPFGKKGEQPYGVTAKDVPLTHLIIRTPDPNAAPPRRRRAAEAGVAGGDRSLRADGRRLQPRPRQGRADRARRQERARRRPAQPAHGRRQRLRRADLRAGEQRADRRVRRRLAQESQP